MPAAARSAQSRIRAAVTLLATGLGATTVALTAILVRGQAAWWLVAFGLTAVVLAGIFPRAPLFVEAVLMATVVGVTLTAAGGRLSAPAAAGVGMFLLGYVLAADLVEAVAHGGGVGRLGLAGWVRSIVLPLAAGVGGGLLMATATVLPLGGGGWLILVAPVALLAAVFVAAGTVPLRAPRRWRRP